MAQPQIVAVERKISQADEITWPKLFLHLIEKFRVLDDNDVGTFDKDFRCWHCPAFTTRLSVIFAVRWPGPRLRDNRARRGGPGRPLPLTISCLCGRARGSVVMACKYTYRRRRKLIAASSTDDPSVLLVDKRSASVALTSPHMEPPVVSGTS